ncbi:MAG: HDOD domain-containing protein [Nitrospirae bacterium]|nr:HDOD domain-containing protein [Nitrospirota bacterium]
MSTPLNCWEKRRCGNCRECPASKYEPATGFLGGQFAGRGCLFIKGTQCSENTMGNMRTKIKYCTGCDFFKRLRKENGEEAVTITAFNEYVKKKTANRNLDADKLRKTEAILKSIGIPTQPKIVLELNREVNNVNASIQSIANLISKDVSLSAQIIKVANSPFFAVRKCDSIIGAINILGLDNFKNIVLISAMRNAIRVDSPILEKFWNHSMLVARIATLIAKRVGDISENNAFMAGLFHDCATPFLLKKYPAYMKDFEKALSNDTSIIEIEDKEFNTSHAIGGYIVSKSMGLADDVCDVVMHHHNADVSIHTDSNNRRLAACLFMADCISFYQHVSNFEHTFSLEKLQSYKQMMFELDLDKEDVVNLCEDVEEIAGQLV